MKKYCPIEVIAFDADDTLWHNDSLFIITQDRFKELFSEGHNPEWIDKKLYEIEIKNLKHFGYGVKAYTLSMIETAIELTEGKIEGEKIQRIIDLGKEMLDSPIELLPKVKEVIEDLSSSYKLMIITKGDLLDQEEKIARSGIADLFAHVEIVSEKNADSYRKILQQYSYLPQQFLMVGNSTRSDILPVLEMGARAIHIPYQSTWEHEKAPKEEKEGKDYFELEKMEQLPKLIRQIEGNI